MTRPALSSPALPRSSDLAGRSSDLAGRSSGLARAGRSPALPRAGRLAGLLRAAGGLAPLLGGLLLAACDDPFPPASHVEGVRVLAVRSDQPLARPGETVGLSMLLHDGGAPLDAPRPIAVAWFGGCDNPAGDSFESCFPRFDWLRSVPAGALVAGGEAPALPPGASIGHGVDFAFRLSDDLIESRLGMTGRPADQGFSYVFFAACAGRLVPATEARPRAGIPIECVDPTSGAALSSDAFVTGYVTVRGDRGRRNANPVITELSVAGVTPGNASCADDAGCGAGEGCSPGGVCLPVVAACREGKIEDCPDVDIRPVVDPASFELDDTSTLPGDEVPPESIWASYFTTAGEMEADSESVVDQGQGARGPDDYAGSWHVEPGFTGVARVFVVLRDARGGTDWRSQDVLVR